MRSMVRSITVIPPRPTRSIAPAHVRRRRQGAVLPLVAVLLILMLAMAALAVDIGYISLVRSQLQAAVDAANFAAASGLPYGPAEVRKRAKASALGNLVNGQPLVLQDSDIELGTWDATQRKFVRLTGLGENDANAVRITGRLTTDRGNSLQLFFGAAVGQRTKNLAVSSVTGGSAGGDVVIVQDITTSFSDELSDAKVADQGLLDGLYANGAGGSSVGIVTHTGWGQTMSPLLPVKSNYTKLSQVISSIKIAGSKGMPIASGTDISSGLLEAMNVFNNSSSQSSGSGAKVIVLVSDGEPNASSKGSNPTLSDSQLLALAQQRSTEAWNKGIHIYVAFFNRDNNQTAAKNVATLARGKGYFVQTTDASKLPEILAEVVKRLPVQLLE